MKFYAHSKPAPQTGLPLPTDHWQPLDEHLQNVANLAADFAKPFGGEAWARAAGLLHDVGKGTLPWQAYLRKANQIVDELAKHFQGRVDHKHVGAREAVELAEQAGKLLAYCIAGHHGGMPNWDDTEEWALRSKLNDQQPPFERVTGTPAMPERLPINLDPKRCGFQIQFFARMLFSCLVDADYLDTAEAMGGASPLVQPELVDRIETFWANFNALREAADPALEVNRQREAVLRDCLASAPMVPGLFSLTVPTGGGKTFASLAFALEHARKHGKRRVIYVIPFTSIIEQNAAEFRKMLGDDAVLEHHCNYIPDEAHWRERLAMENWDAPVIVTTNVQFFDSFYSCKPSRCRKLHRIADSVVIFDEVQAIPVERLRPCMEVLRELSANYGVSSVLCTATQPAIEESQDFPEGLPGVRPIIADVPAFNALKRTTEVFVGTREVEDLAKELASEDNRQVLCVVNTRDQALKLFESMSEVDGTIHLSARMYPEHRRRKLEDIRERIDDGCPCRVFSTQLIEAGVDVDFPVVYRAMAGVDSIAQAAGRCNRNGKHPEPRQVSVFRFPPRLECRFFRQQAQATRKLVERFQGELKSPDCVRAYFLDYFWKNAHRMDEGGVAELCAGAASGNIQFRDIARFRMISSETKPIVVALEEEALALVESLRHAEHKGGILRKLQRFTVSIYPNQFDDLRGWCEEVAPGIYVMSNPDFYDENVGLSCNMPEGQGLFA